MNQAYDIRKDKDERFNEDEWDKAKSQEFEIEVLNTSITHPLVFGSAEDGEMLKLNNCKIVSVTEKKDRNGNLMAFVKVRIDNIEPVEVLVFASSYVKNYDLFDTRYGDVINIVGEKNGKKLKFKKGERK